MSNPKVRCETSFQPVRSKHPGALPGNIPTRCSRVFVFTSLDRKGYGHRSSFNIKADHLMSPFLNTELCSSGPQAFHADGLFDRSS